MRTTLRVFSLLDLICVGFIALQLINWTQNLDMSHYTTTSYLKMAGTLSMFISLFFSAWFLFKQKTAGFIIYYFQFPLRLILWIFSIGFITLLPELLEIYDNDSWFDWLFRSCIIAEFFRLFYTIKFHRSLAR